MQLLVRQTLQDSGRISPRWFVFDDQQLLPELVKIRMANARRLHQVVLNTLSVLLIEIFQNMADDLYSFSAATISI
jgi:hypothetical protein